MFDARINKKDPGARVKLVQEINSKLVSFWLLSIILHMSFFGFISNLFLSILPFGLKPTSAENTISSVKFHLFKEMISP